MEDIYGESKEAVLPEVIDAFVVSKPLYQIVNKAIVTISHM